MSNLLLPEPPADDDRDEFRQEFQEEPPRPSGGSRRRSRPPRRPPTREELLLRLDAVANMLVLGVLEPSSANALRGVIDSMLRAMGGGSATATRTAGPIDRRRWREILREHPGIADELAQFFSEEQLDELLQGYADEEDADDRTGNPGAA